MHNSGIRTPDLVHTFRTFNHYAASVNIWVADSVLILSLTEIIFNSLCTAPFKFTWRLVSNIRRGPGRTTRPGHNIAGPGLHLDLPIAQIRCTAVLGSGNVAPN